MTRRATRTPAVDLDLYDRTDPVLIALAQMRAEAERARRERDAAYRRALGVTDGPLPKVIGNAQATGHAFTNSRFR